MKVAFQGEQGAYSEQALFNYFGGAETLPCESFDLVFDSVANKKCDSALIPIENTLGGSIHQNYDLLAKHNLFIVGETILRVRHSLIALPDVKKEEIKKAISHPQALAQCAEYLRKNNIRPEQVYDTAGSVKMLKESGVRDTAAIASKRAAEIYGMQILEEGIEDNEKNFTRFLAISIEPTVPKKDAKTSILFTLKNQTKSLHQVLNLLAEHHLELTKLESCPLQGKAWEYIFFADFIGIVNDEFLEQAGEHTSMFRLLGSYPKFSN
jgi:prephenate dehydratase